VSPDNRAHNLRLEWAAGERSWRAAEDLRRLGHSAEAVTRYYYACFHAARAALLSLGLEPASHSGVRTLFHQHFVPAVPNPVARTLGYLQQAREDADYSREAVMTPEQADDAAVACGEFRGGRWPAAGLALNQDRASFPRGKLGPGRTSRGSVTLRRVERVCAPRSAQQE